MHNVRLILYGVLGLLVVTLWQAWQIDYGQPHAERPAPESQTAPPPGGSMTGPPDTPIVPPADDSPGEAHGPVQGARPGVAKNTPRGTPPGTPTTVDAESKGERVHIVTDLLQVTLDTQGADVSRALLRNYRVDGESEQRVALLNGDTDERFAVAQSGLQAQEGPAPTHHDIYQVPRSRYELEEGEDTISVPFTWTGDGLHVVKVFTFHRDSYLIEVEYRIQNTGHQPWVGREYHQLQRTRVPESKRSGMFQRGFFGAAYYSQDTKYQQLAYDDIPEASLPQGATHIWAALVDHYFLAAWIPGAEETKNFYTKQLPGPGSRYLIGFYSPGRTLAPGAEMVLSTRLYVGPKETQHLAGIAPGLTNTIDYGYMAFLSRPLFWVLDHVHSLVGNWGWSIIILTMMIKLVFYKLSETSYRSMARMKKLQPKIEQMKERHGDDREKMGRAMMDLYKSEKVNPIGGCLPIVVQIPVFIALYWMLLGSVELRQADWILWINDLSAPDPYFVMPLLMGASMWLQQKLNPPPVDPIQQKIFMALPFVFTVFFAFFPVGLVLYWLTNNLLSIAQQYYITRHVVDRKPAK